MCFLQLHVVEPNIQYSLRVGGEGFFASRYSAEHPDLRLSLSNTDPLIEKERSVRYQESRGIILLDIHQQHSI